MDRLLAVLLVAPAAVLGWPGPGAPLAGDLYPELTGTALAVLALLPAGVLLVIRRAAPRVPGVWLLIGFVAVGLLSLQVNAPTDTLEASRAVMISLCGVVALLGGATLGGEGRAWLARGFVLVSLLLLVPALLDTDGVRAGALQNTGSTSEAALPGAVAGAWLFARGRGAWSVLGALAAALQATYAAVAPVLAGGLCLIAVLLGGATISLATREGRGRAAAAALVASAIFVGTWLARSAGAPPPTSPAGEVAAGEHRDLLGLEVRARIWRRVPPMVRQHGWLGTGPGQFAAAFPPFRDPLEMRRSNFPLSGQESEVEHAHNDWLQGAADTGPTGGLLWLAFLGLAFLASLRALRKDTALAALGAAGAAVLLNALLRGPLLWNPASSTLAFAALGAVLARAPWPQGGGGGAARALTRVALLAAVVGLGSHVGRALALDAHGRLLARAVRDGDPALVERAVEQCPDSVHARSLLARTKEGLETPKQAIAEWRRVLDLRPHRVEALVQIGVLYTRVRGEEQARQVWTHAHHLAPQHAAVLRNLTRLEALTGDAGAALEWAGRGGLDPGELVLLAVDVVRLRGDVDTAIELLAHGDERLAGLTAQRAFELSVNPPPGLEARARTLEGIAQLTWAREHAARGDYTAAVRNYRQARNALAYREPGDEALRIAPVIRLELAAALLLTERELEAQRELERRPAAAPRDLASLPDWAGDALLAAGLLGAP